MSDLIVEAGEIVGVTVERRDRANAESDLETTLTVLTERDTTFFTIGGTLDPEALINAKVKLIVRLVHE
jgi:hypothetical protein